MNVSTRFTINDKEIAEKRAPTSFARTCRSEGQNDVWTLEPDYLARVLRPAGRSLCQRGGVAGPLYAL